MCEVDKARLCDLPPAVFTIIHEQAVIKPTSVQVNQEVFLVPEELRSFAMTNRVIVLSHEQPLEPFLELLRGTMINPDLTRDMGRFFHAWVARYQAKNEGHANRDEIPN